MKTILVAAALAAAWSGAPAAAQTPTRTVAVRDLDLNRLADVAKLDRRLATAARLVCVELGASRYGNYAAAKRCERETLRVANAQRDAAMAAAAGVALAVR